MDPFLVGAFYPYIRGSLLFWKKGFRDLEEPLAAEILFLAPRTPLCGSSLAALDRGYLHRYKTGLLAQSYFIECYLAGAVGAGAAGTAFGAFFLNGHMVVYLP